MIKIAPSILSANFLTLSTEIQKVEKAGADFLHIDITDGHFVPNLTFGLPIVHSIRKATLLPLDIHLMVNNPQDLIIPFIKAGANIITFHIETTLHAHRLIQTIKENGAKAGIALNPSTSLLTIEEIIDELDFIVLMSVNPGFSGQKFILKIIDKIMRTKQLILKKALLTKIEVDGGINKNTANLAITAGADILVAGSAIFNSINIAETIDFLRCLK